MEYHGIPWTLPNWLFVLDLESLRTGSQGTVDQDTYSDIFFRFALHLPNILSQEMEALYIYINIRMYIYLHLASSGSRSKMKANTLALLQRGVGYVNNYAYLHCTT